MSDFKETMKSRKPSVSPEMLRPTPTGQSNTKHSKILKAQVLAGGLGRDPTPEVLSKR